MNRAYLLNLLRYSPAIVINWNRRTLHFSPASLRMQVRMGPWRTAPVHRSIYPQIKAGFVHRHGDVSRDAFASGGVLSEHTALKSTTATFSCSISQVRMNYRPDELWARGPLVADGWKALQIGRGLRPR